MTKQKQAHLDTSRSSDEARAINIGTGTVKFYRVPAAEWEKFLRNRAAV